MCKRCPSAQFVSVAMLSKHRLAFTRKSIDRDCGVSDVIADNNDSVWGAVFSIQETDIALLDKAEGYRPGRRRESNSYVREEYHVWRDGDKERPLRFR